MLGSGGAAKAVPGTLMIPSLGFCGQGRNAKRLPGVDVKICAAASLLSGLKRGTPMNSTVILVSIALLGTGVSSANSATCTTEIDGVSKALASKDAGSGPTVGAAGQAQAPAASAQQHPRTSVMGREFRGRRIPPKMCVAKPKASPPHSKVPPKRVPGPIRRVKPVRLCSAHATSTRKAKRPSAWKPFVRRRHFRWLVEARRRPGDQEARRFAADDVGPRLGGSACRRRGQRAPNGCVLRSHGQCSHPDEVLDPVRRHIAIVDALLVR